MSWTVCSPASCALCVRSCWRRALPVPTLAMMQFGNVVAAVGLFETSSGLPQHKAIGFVVGLGLTQLIVLIGWATSRWLRLQVLVHDKGPTARRNRWDVRRRAWW